MKDFLIRTLIILLIGAGSLFFLYYGFKAANSIIVLTIGWADFGKLMGSLLAIYAGMAVWSWRLNDEEGP